MKRISFPVILIFLFFNSAYSQTIDIHSLTGIDKINISELDSLTFALRNPLGRYSLNVHTVQGITQFKLTDIDSLTSTGTSYLRIKTKTELYQFPIADIDSLTFSSINIPNRPLGALSGTKFIQSIQNMSFTEREPLILQEFSKGNIPDFFRKMYKIKTLLTDSLGTNHEVILEVMPDYLAIGTNEDFYRIPMGPQTAQNIADLYGCVLPTRKIVNIIYSFSTARLEPITYAPVGNNNELVTMFIKHNQEIEAKRLPMGFKLGCLTAGLKKDVVLTNQLPLYPGNVAIYGWHHLDGNPIQSLYYKHVNYYVDYSHGVRLVNSAMWIDGKETTVQKILADPVLYKLISDETGVMTQPRYK